MTRKQFEDKYLKNIVFVELFDGTCFKGWLFSTNDYIRQTNILDMKNYYFVGNDIRDHSLRFRKSHIKKIKILR